MGLLQETLVIALLQLSLDLLDRVKTNTHHDQQAGAAEDELG